MMYFKLIYTAVRKNYSPQRKMRVSKAFYHIASRWEMPIQVCLFQLLLYKCDNLVFMLADSNTKESGRKIIIDSLMKFRHKKIHPIFFYTVGILQFPG